MGERGRLAGLKCLRQLVHAEQIRAAHLARPLRGEEGQAEIGVFARPCVAASRAGALRGGGDVEAAWCGRGGDDQGLAVEVVIDDEGGRIGLCYTRAYAHGKINPSGGLEV